MPHSKPDSDVTNLFSSVNQETAKHVLTTSPYLAEQLSKHPEWVDALVETHTYQPHELQQCIVERIQACEDEATLMRTVRQARHFQTCRIAWRDLSGRAELVETMRDISDLADALVGAALDWWYIRLSQKQGVPRNHQGEEQRLLVLGMGKLGGRELNFSSDIDLIFTFPESGKTDGRREMDNQTFFIRLGQKLINTLGHINGDGFAYRVDMRLRPFGDSGTLALSFDAMEHYYQTHGREWERYAMIKARVIAGDETQAEILMQRLRPFVYRRYLDYGAVEQLRDLKQAINREAKKRGKHQDIKLGKGGIREIEFIAQVFQLMRGGREPSLQQRSLLPTLEVLQALELLSDQEWKTLDTAYRFLRNTENRLQMWADEQTHALPEDTTQQHILALSMGFDDWNGLLQQLDEHRQQVHTIFKQIFSLPSEEHNSPGTAVERLCSGDLGEEAALACLDQLGYQDSAQVYEQLQALYDSRIYQTLTDTALTRLSRLLPRLLQACGTGEQPDQTWLRSLGIVQSIARRSVYMSMLIDNPDALLQLVRLVRGSSWITARLQQHPILLDELMDTRQLYHPLPKVELQAELHHELSRIDAEDTEQFMDRLRQFKNAQTLRVAAADISAALPLMKVSDQLTWIAEAILDSSWQHVWQLMVQKHGSPGYLLDSQSYKAGFAIIGYGKLGGLELGYGSDLDIIFLHDGQGQKQQTDGAKPLENSVFYTRLAQKTVHTLSTFTHDGRLYETDTRLRPSGASGLLVSSLEAFRTYQQGKAWVWEHQALLRARAITGTPELMAAFEAIRREILCQPRDAETLAHEVVSMREKMWETLGSKDPCFFNLKKDPGGITDIEFLVQYLILTHAHAYPKLVHWSDNIRQLESLQQYGLLETDEAKCLAEIYQMMRNRIHALALQEQKAFVPVADYQGERAYVRECWGKHLQVSR